MTAFNKLRIKKGEKWKTAFRTCYGLFEYLVMSFELCNAPAFFQHYINDALRKHLDVFCTAYIDDILVYSENLKKHKAHMKMMLEALRKADLQVDIFKCEFHVEEVLYLELIVGKNRVHMNSVKVAAICKWETLKSVKDVQAFLGFANFYRRFIKAFSRITAPCYDHGLK